MRGWRQRRRRMGSRRGYCSGEDTGLASGLGVSTAAGLGKMGSRRYESVICGLIWDRRWRNCSVQTWQRNRRRKLGREASIEHGLDWIIHASWARGGLCTACDLLGFDLNWQEVSLW
jgi:hypothetical protein